ncbi:MAG: hypothetical protein WCN95_14345 [bacterium]
MKYATFLLVCLSIGKAAYGVTPDELRLKLGDAASECGTNYLHARDAIVAFGSDITPLLKQVLDAKTEPWRFRLMAGICAERIERGQDIAALVNKDWSKDPEYDTQWARCRAGALPLMIPLAVKRYKEARLWFYYVEMVWKETEEHSQAFRRWDPDWRLISRQACAGSPAFDLLVRVLDERIRNDIGFTKFERWGEFNFLVESKTNTALPFLLEIIPQIPASDSQREDQYFRILKTMAQPADVPLIEKHFKDKGQEIPLMLTGPFNALKRRAAANEGK